MCDALSAFGFFFFLSPIKSKKQIVQEKPQELGMCFFMAVSYFADSERYT